MKRQDIENMFGDYLSKYINIVNSAKINSDIVDALMYMKCYDFKYCYKCGVLYTFTHKVLSWDKNLQEAAQLWRCHYDHSPLQTIDLPFEIVNILEKKHKVIHNDTAYSQKISIEELSAIVFEIQL